MVRVVHIMPGRLRLRMDAMKRRPGLAAQLHQHLASVEGIRRVEVSPRTGSVLLAYDPRALGSADFLDDLCQAMGTLFPNHFAPGRVRVRVDLLKGRPQLAHNIQQRLLGIGGIHQLEIDPSDGACLIVYDSDTVTSPEFFTMVSQSLGMLLPWLDVKQLILRTGLERI